MHDIRQSQPFHQSADGHKFHAVRENIDNGITGIIVVSVYDGVEQGFPKGIFRVGTLFNANETFEICMNVIEQADKFISLF